MNGWLPGCTEEYAQLPGLRLHYITSGPRDGEPVILLHGFPEFWYSWRFQIPALAEAGYRVIAPDQRGYNLTDKNGPYDTTTLSGDIAHLQDALGVTSSHVIGHDWGGAIAWTFAARFPQRTRKLVILNAPHPNAYLDTIRRHPRQILLSWYIYFFQIPALPELLFRANNYRLIDQAFSRVHPSYMTAADVQRYKDACAQPGALSAMIGWYRATFRDLLAQGGNPPRLAINAPTAVIWGEGDDYLDRRCNDTLRRYVAQLDLHFLGDASHWVQLDRPDVVNSLILGFLR